MPTPPVRQPLFETSDNVDFMVCVPLSASHWPLQLVFRNRGGVQKSMGSKVPWKTGMLLGHPERLRDHSFSYRKKQFYLPATSRPPI